MYASSAAVYGAAGEAGALAEDGLTAPLSAYGADKLGSELHARAGAVVHGVPSVGFRFFNVYGPRQDPRSPYSGVISLFAQALVEDRGLVLHGDGEQTRDFIYVGDVVAHLVAGMRHAAGHAEAAVFNACTGRECSVRSLALTMGQLLQRRPSLSHGPARAGDIRRSVGDPARAIAALDVVARTGLPAGLERTLQGIVAQSKLVRA